MEVSSSGAHSEGEGDRDSCPSVVPTSLREDISTVMIVATVERLLKRSSRKQRVLCEAQNELSFSYFPPHFLPPKSSLRSASQLDRNPQAIFSFCPAFMEGRVFCPRAINSLLCALFSPLSSSFFSALRFPCLFLFLTNLFPFPHSIGSFYNSHLVSLLENLLEGVTFLEDSLKSRGKLIRQIPLPEKFVGKTFQDIFSTFLLEEGKLVLGLFRGRSSAGVSPCPFVFTNPWPHSILGEEDLLFYL